MRLINTELGEALGKPVIVENRGGAGGSLGTAFVARAPADGYTLLGCSSAFVVNPSLYANVAYDPFKDFVPIMVIGAAPNLFVVPKQSKINTMQDFIAEAKANPGKLNWTSPGAGTTPQLAGELLKSAAGIDIIHIPFTGAGLAMTAVLGGQVDMYAGNYGSMGSLLSSVRPLAVTSDKRWPDLPDTPTLAELGIRVRRRIRSRRCSRRPARRSRSSTGWRKSLPQSLPGRRSARNSQRSDCRWLRRGLTYFAHVLPMKCRCIRR